MNAFRLGMVALAGWHFCQAGNLSAAEAPLPSVGTVLDGMVERARKEAGNDYLFLTTYSCIKSNATEYRNPKGEVKKRDIVTSTNDPATTARTGPPPVIATDDNSPEPYKSQEFAVTKEVLQRFEFKVAGRETLRGRPTLILDFLPAKGKQPERSLKERFINKAGGRIWVDEAEYAVAKAELYLTERVNVLGGLAGMVRKFTCDFERERLEDGVWYARETEWHLEGRELFTRKLVDFHESQTGVGKMPTAKVAATAPLAGLEPAQSNAPSQTVGAKALLAPDDGSLISGH